MTALMVIVSLVTTMLSINIASALPFPAPEIQRCQSTEDCCPPTHNESSLRTEFQFPTSLPMRTRRAANLVDLNSEYATKLRKAYELMRALPDSDGRSLKNQARLHCAYCDNHFYFDGNAYPLEIHQNWLFLPWHRMFVYFHERILATLIGDEEFALPFWYWDDGSAGEGSGNLVPEVYAGNSSLGDGDRNACAARPNVVDFVDPFEGCLANKTSERIRTENAHLTYTHMVTGAVTPSLFFGRAYRYGDQGGVGGGTLEIKPHAPVHLWVNVIKMLTNQLSASDPIFYAHHSNVDRLWTLWKRLPGGVRKDLSDPDWLDTKFTYFDEFGGEVVISVAQSLDIDKLRYKYEEAPIPWSTGSVNTTDNTTPATWLSCNNDSTTADIQSMIETTPPFQSPLAFNSDPTTFRVERKPSSGYKGEEVLQLKGRMDWTLSMTFVAFLNLPGATTANTSLQGCREYLGTFVATPHVGSSSRIPHRMKWRVALSQKLKDLGVEGFAQVAITILGPQRPNNQTISITSAKIFYINE